MSFKEGLACPTEFDPVFWKQVEAYADQFLVHGRPDWDVPHTRATVDYAVRLARAAGLDPLVLGTAAWCHDIGYYVTAVAGLASRYDSVQDKKVVHMLAGAELTRQFVNQQSGCLTGQQADRVVHLVGIHDNPDCWIDPDAIVLMEADTFGAIDLRRVTPTFRGQQAQKYLELSLYGKRVPVIRQQGSVLGRQVIKELLPPFERWVADSGN